MANRREDFDLQIVDNTRHAIYLIADSTRDILG